MQIKDRLQEMDDGVYSIEKVFHFLPLAGVSSLGEVS
jgi:hypothetical protein